MDWDLFRSEGLSRALTDAGHDVSKRTVDRWKSGESTPSKGHLEAIKRLVCGHTETAPPSTSESGAVQELSEKVDQIITRSEVLALVADVQKAVTAEIKTNRDVILGGLGREMGARVAKEIEPLLSQLRAVLAHADDHRAE